MYGQMVLTWCIQKIPYPGEPTGVKNEESGYELGSTSLAMGINM